MWPSIRCAISWKNVLVVRPQPGHARHLGQERAQAQRLEHLLRDAHLLGAVATRLGRERDADGVADALVEQDRRGRRSRRRCPSCPCRPRSGRGGAGSRSARELRGRRPRGRRTPLTLALMMMRSWPQAGRLGQLGRAQGRLEHRLDHHVARVERRRPSGRSRPSASVRSAWSSEPQLTPMRTGLSCRWRPGRSSRSARRGAWRRRCPG